jgi:hypothetical protein
MKLRKQTGAKTFILAATLGLLAAFFGLVKSEPRIKAQETLPAAEPAVDYERFFAPGGSQGSSAPLPPVLPHTRTRAS